MTLLQCWLLRGVKATVRTGCDASTCSTTWLKAQQGFLCGGWARQHRLAVEAVPSIESVARSQCRVPRARTAHRYRAFNDSIALVEQITRDLDVVAQEDPRHDSLPYGVRIHAYEAVATIAIDLATVRRIVNIHRAPNRQHGAPTTHPMGKRKTLDATRSRAHPIHSPRAAEVDAQTRFVYMHVATGVLATPFMLSKGPPT